MKSLAIPLIIGSIAVAFATGTKAQPPRFVASYGMGRQRCAVWYFSDRPRDGIANDARSSPTLNDYYEQWVDGFISGVAYGSTEPVAQAASDAVVQHFLNDYCAAHGLDTFETAAKALLVELKKR